MSTIQEFNYSVDILKAVLWQYDKADNLIYLLSKKQEWYDLNQKDFWEDWFNNVFNLLTANAFGLSVWCEILQVPLFLELNPDPEDKPIFGFNDNSNYPILENTYFNFENGNFSNSGDALILTVEQQRFLLRLRYYQLVTRGEVWDINLFLSYLVETSDIGFTGKAYALDGLKMNMRYVVTTGDFPRPLLDAIIQLDLWPRPAGVRIEVLWLNGATFGFNDNSNYPELQNTYLNFENGNFYDGLYYPRSNLS